MFVSIFIFGKGTLRIPIIILVYFSKIYSRKYRKYHIYTHSQDLVNLKKSIKTKKHILLKIVSVA